MQLLVVMFDQHHCVWARSLSFNKEGLNCQCCNRCVVSQHSTLLLMPAVEQTDHVRALNPRQGMVQCNAEDVPLLQQPCAAWRALALTPAPTPSAKFCY